MLVKLCSSTMFKAEENPTFYSETFKQSQSLPSGLKKETALKSRRPRTQAINTCAETRVFLFSEEKRVFLYHNQLMFCDTCC